MIGPERLARFIDRLEQLLDHVEPLLPASAASVDWQAQAFRWRVRQGRGQLEPVRHPHLIRLDQLVNVGLQRDRLLANTRQFVNGRLANNVLLTGARGCGKSSLVKAVWNELRDQDLRLIEVEKTHLVDLPDIVQCIAGRPERFIVFCDDLSFEEGDHGYQALKTTLDGSIAAPSANMLLYATSNRRHLVPEYFSENAQSRHLDGEIHPGEAIEDKIALSERFGLWLSFYGFSQDEYLAAVRRWLHDFGVNGWDEVLERAALQWAQGRGARSGRVAWQFARDWAGSHGGA
ncbi:ATP-binding protein [Chitiniphilus purpureus]|uniref:ATP-binding protein n=1 Tax=Chitiniphilus purpureus TaxID=2981137 RepID=A0ABY6DL04_9NEIS|nr:ATP-binding protein [Chitiniphilus sp. CD1]UXY14717.1 ATP-binding protein [Chitiniphilus sp. CD1]